MTFAWIDKRQLGTLLRGTFLNLGESAECTHGGPVGL